MSPHDEVRPVLALCGAARAGELNREQQDRLVDLFFALDSARRNPHRTCEPVLDAYDGLLALMTEETS